MYERFMELIEKNADRITGNIMIEISKRNEVRHYKELPEEVARERVSRVVRNVYQRLESWLNKNKPKNTLFAYYSNLGSERCSEGIPLEEVIMLIMMIKREIWYVISDQIVTGSGFPLKEINFYGGLFFDRIIHSIISGYQAELGTICKDPGGNKDLIEKIFNE
jgi:hypothetical protein